MHVMPNEESLESSFHAEIQAGLARLGEGGFVNFFLEDGGVQNDLTNQILIEEQVDHVIVPGFDVFDRVQPLILAQPLVNFSVVDVVPDINPFPRNIRALVFAEAEGGYLAGALAGHISINKRVGAICGTPFDSVRKFRTGFINGVRETCPECKIDIYTAFTFINDNFAERVADTAELNGVDVLFNIGGGLGSSTIFQAAARGIQVIGVDNDQYQTLFRNGQAENSDKIVTSMLKRLSVAVERIIDDFENGLFLGGEIFNLDLASNGLELAPCHEACNIFSESVNATMLRIENDLIAGVLSTGSTFEGDFQLQDRLYDRRVAENSFTDAGNYDKDAPLIISAMADTVEIPGINDRSIYMFGGSKYLKDSGTSEISDELWSLNLAGMFFTFHDPGLMIDSTIRPTARTSGTLVTVESVGTYMLLFGGASESGDLLGDVWLLKTPSFVTNFEAVTETWVQVTASGGPQARKQHCGASIGNKVFIFGGIDASQKTLNDMWAYDVVEESWTQVCDDCGPPERISATLTAFDGILILHGGRDQANDELADVWIFNPSTANQDNNGFSKSQDGPAGRWGHQAVKIFTKPPGLPYQNVVAIIGGSIAPGTSSIIEDSIAYFLLQNEEWVTIPYAKSNNQQCETIEEGDDAATFKVGQQVVAQNRRNFIATSRRFDSDEVSDKIVLFGGQIGQERMPQGLEIFHPSENAINEDFQRIGMVVKVIIGGLSAAMISVAAALIIWTYKNRKTPVILASQLPFLIMIGVGCILSSSAVFGVLLDDADDVEELSRTGDFFHANLGCELLIWLYGTGFVLTFAPLFVKIWRIQKIFNNVRLKRVFIPSSQLILVCLLLLTIEWSILFAWTYTDPLRYFRTSQEVDQFGNTIRSIGNCQSENAFHFLAPLLVFHLGILFYGNLISWRSRKIEDVFAETRAITLVLVSFLQVLSIAAPVLVIVSDQPLAYATIVAGVILLQNVSVLVFIFGKKVLAVLYKKKFALTSSSQGEGITITNSKTKSRTKTSNRFDNLSELHTFEPSFFDQEPPIPYTEQIAGPSSYSSGILTPSRTSRSRVVEDLANQNDDDKYI